MNNIWLHRISWNSEVSYPLLDKGYLSIGWSGLSTPEFVEKSCTEGGMEFFDNTFSDNGYGIPRNRFSLWRFITEMKKDDLVVIPSFGGTFQILRIEDDKALAIPELLAITDIEDEAGNAIKMGDDRHLHNNGVKDEKGNDKLIDLGFFRKVKQIIPEISRSDYADAALTARMKVRQTTVNISDLQESVDKVLAAYQSGKPLSIYSSIVERTSQTIIDAIHTELTPDKFEHLVKWYFERIGATNVDIPAKNEREKMGDADVVATFEVIKTIIYTQVKFHEGETSSWAIEQINDYKAQKDGTDDGYSKIAWVISSGADFSQEAKTMASEANIQLFSVAQFAIMLLEAGIANLNKVK